MKLEFTAEFEDDHGYSWDGARQVVGDARVLIGDREVLRLSLDYRSNHQADSEAARAEEADQVAAGVAAWFDRVNDMLDERDAERERDRL